MVFALIRICMPTGCYSREFKNNKPTVCGIGIAGSSRKSVKVDGRYVYIPEYVLWKNLINRCYNENSLKRFERYRGCSVCDRWLHYDNFIEDLPNLKGYGEWISGLDYELDKDIRVAGNRVYSPDTCMFISSQINGGEGGKRSALLRRRA